MHDKDKVIEKKKGIVKAELGYHLHVSLRKICDSEPTSLMWNLIGTKWMLEAWLIYLEKVWSDLDLECYNEINVHSLLNRAAITLNNVVGNKAPSAEAIILYCGFRLFSSEDWRGMACHLAKEMREQSEVKVQAESVEAY